MTFLGFVVGVGGMLQMQYLVSVGISSSSQGGEGDAGEIGPGSDWSTELNQEELKEELLTDNQRYPSQERRSVRNIKIDDVHAHHQIEQHNLVQERTPAQLTTAHSILNSLTLVNNKIEESLSEDLFKCSALRDLKHLEISRNMFQPMKLPSFKGLHDFRVAKMHRIRCPPGIPSITAPHIRAGRYCGVCKKMVLRCKIHANYQCARKLSKSYAKITSHNAFPTKGIFCNNCDRIARGAPSSLRTSRPSYSSCRLYKMLG